MEYDGLSRGRRALYTIACRSAAPRAAQRKAPESRSDRYSLRLCGGKAIGGNERSFVSGHRGHFAKYFFTAL